MWRQRGSKKGWETLVWSNDSQPGYRGTLGYRKEVLGVPPNFELLPLHLTTCDAKIVIFNQVRVPPNLFKGLKGAAKKKKLKTLV